MMNSKIGIIGLLCCLYFNCSLAQTPFTKGNLYLGVDLGLSFYNEELAHLNSQLPLDYQMNDAIRFSLAPKIECAIADRLMLIGQVGVDFQNYKYQQTGQRFKTNNYRLGGGLKYYIIKIIEGFYASTEAGLAYNYFHIQQSNQSYEETSQSLLSAYLDFSFDFFVSEKVIFSIVFSNLIDYHAAFPNFEYREGWQLNSVFTDFFHFPHFSVMYRLN